MPCLVAITGASGLLGGNLATELIERGYSVRGLRRHTSNIDHLSHLPIDWREVDLSDPVALQDALAGVSAVFHCAGETAQSRWLRPEHRIANIDATKNVLDASVAVHVDRLIHCSSTMTCGLSIDGSLVAEDSEASSPVKWYDDGYLMSKRIAEKAVLSAADRFDVVVVNPGFMFGPLDAKPSSGRLILNVARGMTPCWTAGSNNFVDSRDVASGMIAALEGGRRGERYILGGENLPYRQAVKLIARQLGVSPPRFLLPYAPARTAGWFGDVIELMGGQTQDINSSTVQYAYCDSAMFSHAKASRELAYRPRPVGKAIEAAIAWFREAQILH